MKSDRRHIRWRNHRIGTSRLHGADGIRPERPRRRRARDRWDQRRGEPAGRGEPYRFDAELSPYRDSSSFILIFVMRSWYEEVWMIRLNCVR